MVDGVAHPTLQFELPTHQSVTLLIDPKTSLLRRMQTDLREFLKKRGSSDVKQAEVTVEYTSVVTNAAASDDTAFAWTPPPGASLTSEAGSGGPEAGAPSPLVGKPAPDFTLKDMNDKPVTLSSLKGSVVLLDFWATWCGPCVGAMPHTDQLHRELSPKGLKVFAVDEREEKDAVKLMLTEQKWTLPVLLDTNGDAGGPYGTANGIPVTVIIGKDGIVKKVVEGTNDEIQEAIKESVIREMGP